MQHLKDEVPKGHLTVDLLEESLEWLECACKLPSKGSALNLSLYFTGLAQVQAKVSKR